MLGESQGHDRRFALLAFLTLLAAFVGLHAGELGELQHLIDEGVNVVSARRIQGGEQPYRDFIYHQLPTYLFTLSLLPTDHLWYGRLLSTPALRPPLRILRPVFRSFSPSRLRNRETPHPANRPSRRSPRLFPREAEFRFPISSLRHASPWVDRPTRGSAGNDARPRSALRSPRAFRRSTMPRSWGSREHPAAR